MHVVIVHYHLRRGGVTRVIDNAIRALRAVDADVEVMVLTGEEPGDKVGYRWRVVPQLLYQSEASAAQAKAIAQGLRSVVRDFWGEAASEVLWHVHNSTLGKNVAFPAALRMLIDDGARCLIQLHDFAEDGRPANFRRQRAFFESFDQTAAPDEYLYPCGSRVRYALLNNRDASILQEAGLSSDYCYRLPNPVSVSGLGQGDGEPAPDQVSPYLLYPTRGIRRKNMGELALLSYLHGRNYRFVSTLSPDNEEWQAIHEDWRLFAAVRGLPLELGVADSDPDSFVPLVQGSSGLITTSVAEGFGLAFLEPWLMGKSVVGRNLPEITSDFDENGIALEHLYRSLPVPVEALDYEGLRERLTRVYRESMEAYGRSANDSDLLNALILDGRVDFGVLDEPLQRVVIDAVMERADLLGKMELPSIVPLSGDEIAERRAVVERLYSLTAYGRRLYGIYQVMMQAEDGPVSALSADTILDQFLKPERFTLLRA